MSSTNTNGHVARKTLASQLDRLDSIIDALANGLNETVADVVKQAVTVAVSQTVEAVLRKVLSRPELLRQLAGPAAPVATVVEPKPTQPSLLKKALSWVGSKIGNASRWVGTKVSNGWTAICDKIRRLPVAFHGLGEKMGEGIHRVWELRRPVLISLLIGLLVGGIGFMAGPLMSSVALGMCSSAMSLASFLIAPFVRLWKSLQTESA
jgi:hypothetical protein